MGIDTFRTTFNQKPAEVTINGANIEVQLGGKTGTIWRLDKALTPTEYQATSGNYAIEFKKDATSGLLTRNKSAVHGWQVVTPETDKELATFSTALAVIEAASLKAGFPQAIKDALPDAHKALGLPYNAERQRS